MFKGILQKYSVRAWHEFILLMTVKSWDLVNTIIKWGISLSAEQLYQLHKQDSAPWNYSVQNQLSLLSRNNSLSILQDSDNSISHLGSFTARIVHCLVLKNNKTIQD
jgi:hypothetical protein